MFPMASFEIEKEEVLDGYADGAGASTSGDLAEELRKASGARAHQGLEAAARMAAEAGTRPSAFRTDLSHAGCAMSAQEGLQEVNKHSGPHVLTAVSVKTLKYSVDTGSSVTLVRPDLVPGWTQFEPTTVQLRTVTGELAPMKAECENTPPLLSPTQCSSPSPASMTCLSVNTGHTPLAQQPQAGEETTLLAVRGIWEKNYDGLSPQQQEQLWQLLLRFKDSFALCEEGLGQTHLGQHEIDTGDALPIRMRPRRLPLAQQEAADKALREMQQAGITEPSESPWASPIVTVRKKGGCVGSVWRVLAGIPRKECQVYLDDILAHGSLFEVALGALRRVLERVAAAGLKLHPE
ncbi:hypothetical protein AAFF_G00084990 [Aldrovandia affinis]|uniref:Uncharacterized protein n=1 Tax=Aldrovandia affinis TaxID=143900 RepID=A0AAD7RWX2_9TELE|nr:hypothetical protein AAFF_G00084990 [Aldrovandia affinis]